MYNCGGGSVKSQFRKADKSGANVALVLGESEIASGTVAVKWLREQREQLTCTQAEAIGVVRDALLISAQ